jgi:HSP20 family protein
MMRNLWGENAPELAGAAAYPVDIWEDDDNVFVEAEIPGYKKEEITVTLEDGMLQISAERMPQERSGSLHLNERRYLRYFRAFSMPTAVEDETVKASFENGILHLTLPKRPEVKPRRIQVN